MADSDELSLDMLFDWLERFPLPERYKAEIVEGAIFMSRQRQTHWQIIFGIALQLSAQYPKSRIASDVRIDFPGHLNGFCCDVAALKEGAVRDHQGRRHYEDVEFVAEVISKNTARNDYGPKKDAFALAGVPAYLIVPPRLSGSPHGRKPSPRPYASLFNPRPTGCMCPDRTCSGRTRGINLAQIQSTFRQIGREERHSRGGSADGRCRPCRERGAGAGRRRVRQGSR